MWHHTMAMDCTMHFQNIRGHHWRRRLRLWDRRYSRNRSRRNGSNVDCATLWQNCLRLLFKLSSSQVAYPRGLPNRSNLQIMWLTKCRFGFARSAICSVADKYKFHKSMLCWSSSTDKLVPHLFHNDTISLNARPPSTKEIPSSPSMPITDSAFSRR